MKKFEFTIKGHKYEVLVKDFDDNIANIEVNGTTYEVEVHKEVKVTKTPKLIRKAVVSKPGEGAIPQKSSGLTKVKAPLPGSIFKLIVAEGDSVKKGDVLSVDFGVCYKGFYGDSAVTIPVGKIKKPVHNLGQ